MTKDFFTWWGEGLMLLLPGERSNHIGRNKTTLLLCIDRGEYQLFNQKNDLIVKEEKPIVKAEENLLKEIFDQAAVKDSMALDIKIRNSEVLTREISLPINTEENLYEVIQYEMDRYTPFNKDDVYFDYQIKERNVEKQLIKVILVVLKKNILNSTVSAIEKSNVHLRNIEVFNPEEPEKNLKGIKFFRENNSIRKRKSSSNNWLLASLAVLLVLTGITPIVMNYVQINRLSSELESMEGVVKQVKDLQSEYQKMQVQVGYLIKIKENNPSIIEMLNLLTKMIPDHTYVQRLSLENGQLSIQGSSASASELIAIIDQTDLFDDIRFAAPVTQSHSDGLERYSISANIKTQTVPGES